MSKLTDFAVKHVLPILEHIAPHWTEELKVNFAVNAEKDRRPHPFSLFTGMGMGPPPEGDTADTAKPLPPHAPAAPHNTLALTALPFAPSGYVSWPGLADRRYTGRHLPPAPSGYAESLPDIERVIRTLYLRKEGEFTPCNQTSTLFCLFAQWFLYTALSTMCVREHNRLASVLAARHASWDDDRLFETARIVMIRNVLQIVVEDYINHLAGGFDFKLDRHFAEHQSWYRSNRISLEFNLLYRWHSLVPERFTLGGTNHSNEEYRFNNGLLEKLGIEHCINAASTQHAGRIQLHNTPAWLWKAEMASLDVSRTFALQPFVAYCDRFSRKPPETIAELVGGDERTTQELTDLYGNIDRVELPVGLIAQARDEGEEDAVLPPLVRTMVAVDAFTHIFTNPLLAGQVYEAAFDGAAADVGDLTNGTGGIAGLMKRNSMAGTLANPSFKVRAAAATD